MSSQLPRSVTSRWQLKPAMVRVFTPPRWANTAYQVFPPGELVVKHLPAHHCHWLTQEEMDTPKHWDISILGGQHVGCISLKQVPWYHVQNWLEVEEKHWKILPYPCLFFSCLSDFYTERALTTAILVTVLEVRVLRRENCLVCS